MAQGGFSYTAPDGTVINLNYIADDENGFRPEVSSLIYYDSLVCKFLKLITTKLCDFVGDLVGCG